MLVYFVVNDLALDDTKSGSRTATGEPTLGTLAVNYSLFDFDLCVFRSPCFCCPLCPPSPLCLPPVFLLRGCPGPSTRGLLRRRLVPLCCESGCRARVGRSSAAPQGNHRRAKSALLPEGCSGCVFTLSVQELKTVEHVKFDVKPC